MPGVVSQSRAVVASIAAILSLVLAGPASASGGPLSGLTDAVSNVTTGVGQTVDSVGTVVEDVTGAEQSSSSGSQDQPAQPEPAPAPAADTDAAPQPAAPAPTAVTAVTAVTRTVVAETVPAIAATTNRLASAASDTAEPVLGAALGNMRAVTGSAVAATGCRRRRAQRRGPDDGCDRDGARAPGHRRPGRNDFHGDDRARRHSRPARRNRPDDGRERDGARAPGHRCRPRRAGLNDFHGDDRARQLRRRRSSRLLARRARTAPPRRSPGRAPAAASRASPSLPERLRTRLGRPSARARQRSPGAPTVDVLVLPSTQVSETPLITQSGSPPRAGAGDGGTAVPSLAPPTRTAVPSTGSSAAGGAPGFAFVGFAVLAGFFVLAAPALGRRLKLWPALVRPLAFVSPPERPG